MTIHKTTTMKQFKTYTSAYAFFAILVICIMLNLSSTNNSIAQSKESNVDHLEQIEGHENVVGAMKNHRWSYQPEETETGKYYQPAYTATLPLMVERNKIRIDSLEDRVEKLEKALTAAINTINAQSNIIKKMNQ